MVDTSDSLIAFAFAAGTILIYLAVFFPKALRFFLLRRWFYVGPEGTPGGAILIGIALILFGLVGTSAIAEYYRGLVAFGAFFLIVAALIYDSSQSGPK